ncbi:MAG: hypothetical protein NT154_38710, partial [Verrucomicrobia bacterium]|nr:hypothetical protein [Verrucomicrobiota bacterium]
STLDGVLCQLVTLDSPTDGLPFSLSSGERAGVRGNGGQEHQRLEDEPQPRSVARRGAWL